MKKIFIYFLLIILSVLTISCTNDKQTNPITPSFISIYRLNHSYSNKPLPKEGDRRIPFSGSLEFRAGRTYTIITYFLNFKDRKIWTDSEIDIGIYIIYDDNTIRMMKESDQTITVGIIEGDIITISAGNIQMVYQRIL